MNKLFTAFTRTKHLTSSDVQNTELYRCLSTLDLTAIGVGSTLGAGVYVVTGQVAKLQAGPAIVLSFSIAAFASILSGLCYAELASRVPKAGSAYVYTYVTIGELCAFVIGWNLLLEYIVAAASVAKAWSAFFDSLLGDHIHEAAIHTLGKINVPGLSEYPDFVASIFILLTTMVLMSGVKISSTINWIFTSINVLVISFVTIAGLVYAEIKNWDDFMPYGFSGVLSGAATCFFAFVGFDVVATSGEEAKTPSKSIPVAIIASLSICFVAYLGASLALTLMLPYNVLDKNTALASSFHKRGFKVGKYIVAVGAICGLSSSELNSLFPLPRILYAMGSDGVIFAFFARVYKGTGIPVIACVISGIFTALLALILDLVSLVEMMSIGTLLAYTLVSLCVLLLRYRPCGFQLVEDSGNDEYNEGGNSDKTSTENLIGEMKTGTSENEAVRTTADNDDDDTRSLHNHASQPSMKDTRAPPTFVQQLLGVHDFDEPTEVSYGVVKIALVLFFLLTVALQICLIWAVDDLLSKDPFMIIFFVFLLMSLLIVITVIGRQPQSKTKLHFKVPLLPVIPLLAIFVNLYLMFMLSHLTWIRLAVWMTVGMSIYFFYGIKHSKENREISAKADHGYTQLKNNMEHSD